MKISIRRGRKSSREKTGLQFPVGVRELNGRRQWEKWSEGLSARGTAPAKERALLPFAGHGRPVSRPFHWPVPLSFAPHNSSRTPLTGTKKRRKTTRKSRWVPSQNETCPRQQRKHKAQEKRTELSICPLLFLLFPTVRTLLFTERTLCSATLRPTI